MTGPQSLSTLDLFTSVAIGFENILSKYIRFEAPFNTNGINQLKKSNVIFANMVRFVGSGVKVFHCSL